VFALNSAVHSYLILAYAQGDKVAMNVGFYYMANAGGRLAGTVLSGALYEWQGLAACLWVSAGFVVIAGLLSRMLPEVRSRRTAPPAQHRLLSLDSWGSAAEGVLCLFCDDRLQRTMSM